jgi:hypothetical protein
MPRQKKYYPLAQVFHILLALAFQFALEAATS